MIRSLMIPSVLTRCVLASALVFGLMACKKKVEAADAGLAALPKAPAAATAPTTAAAPQNLSWQEGLKSQDAAVRAQACAAVLPSELPAPPPELLAALADADATVRTAAARGVLGFILQNADGSAIPKLLEMAEKDASPEARREAVRALGGLSHREVVPTLVRLFSAEKDPAARELMLSIFAKDGDRRALALIVGLLKEKDPPAAALEAIRRVADKAPAELVKLVGHPDAATRRLAVQALGEIGDPAAVPELLKAARDKDATVASDALNGLALLGGPEAIATVLELCDHADAAVRVGALRALATYRTPSDIGADDAAPRVLKQLKAGPDAVRIEAARTIAFAQLKRAIPALRELAASAKEPQAVRAAALEALGKIGDAAALPTLTAILADKGSPVRAAAATAIGLLGKTAASAAAALVLSLGDAEFEAKLEAVKALGLVGATDAAAKLKELGEKSDNPLLQAEAGGALLLLGRTEGAALLRPVLTGAKDWEERAAAARLIEVRSWQERREDKLTPEQQALVTAVTALISDALKAEKEPLVREVLYRQLARARGPAAIPAQKVGLDERVPFFRLMAAAGLCRNGEQAGCDALAQSLDAADATVRAEAARRCGFYRVKSATAALTKASDDPVSFVANAARHALASIEAE